MNDSYVKTEYTSIGGRLKESIKGIVFGGILFILAFPVLFWNEGRAVKTAQALDEGAGAVISVPSEKADAGNGGKLVHMTGLATTDETLTDPVFGVSFAGISLSRNVKMYQWIEDKKVETEKNLGGGEERVTTYTYRKEWSNHLINSSRFANQKGHINPTSIPYKSESYYADKVTVGAFDLTTLQTKRIGGERDLPVTTEFLNSADPSIRGKFRINGSHFGTGEPAAPKIGDLRVSFSVVEPTTVSLVATQRGETFEPYIAKSGYRVDLFQTGTHTAEAMFEQAEAVNKFFTWLLRVIGFLMMWFGLSLIARPLVVVADIVPIVGTIVGMGAGFFAFAIAAPATLMTIAFAWFYYRPLLGIALAAVGVGIFVWGVRKARARQTEAVA